MQPATTGYDQHLLLPRYPRATLFYNHTSVTISIFLLPSLYNRSIFPLHLNRLIWVIHFEETLGVLSLIFFSKKYFQYRETFFQNQCYFIKIIQNFLFIIYMYVHYITM